MGTTDRTKQQLAAGLKQMITLMPLRKVRVRELCENCGVDRRTFYYHFRDIYDLSAWIFTQHVDTALVEYYGRPCFDALVLALTKAREDELFYRRALEEDSQNALGRFILSHNVKMYEHELVRLRGGTALSAEDSFAVGYHCFASLGMVRRWLFSEHPLYPEELAKLLIHTMPPVLRTLYETPLSEQKKEEKR